MNKHTCFTALVVLVSLTAAPAALADGGMLWQLADFEQLLERSNDGNNAPRSFTRCSQGFAGDFPCDKVDLLSYVPLADLGASFINDIWGWTDPQTGKDYALVGAIEGMIVVDIADPKRPVVKGILPTHSDAGGDFWRDIKVYADHAFVVSENDEHGMQVLDLTVLRQPNLSGASLVLTETSQYVPDSLVTFAETAHYTLPGDGNAHNIAINEATGFAYVLGSDDCSGGLHMVDISDPANPTFAGCFGTYGYVHDAQCVIYEGPDADYQGREICFGSNGSVPSPNTVSIVDVTDKGNPVGIANVGYADAGYSNQGWLTPDQAYFLHGDELDELFLANDTRTRVWDLRDLDNPVVIGVFDNTTASIDHNIFVSGRYAFASNYTAGLRVYDTRDVSSGELSEAAYFDVYPENDNATFEGGSWGNYPFFSQKGVVAVTSIDRGLFILQPRIGKSGK